MSVAVHIVFRFLASNKIKSVLLIDEVVIATRNWQTGWKKRFGFGCQNHTLAQEESFQRRSSHLRRVVFF